MYWNLFIVDRLKITVQRIQVHYLVIELQQSRIIRTTTNPIFSIYPQCKKSSTLNGKLISNVICKGFMRDYLKNYRISITISP